MFMTQIVKDKKKYILIPEKEYHALQVRAALKGKPVKKLLLATGKKHAYQLIDKWAKKSKYYRTDGHLCCRNSLFY